MRRCAAGLGVKFMRNEPSRGAFVGETGKNDPRERARARVYVRWGRVRTIAARTTRRGTEARQRIIGGERGRALHA